MLTVRGFLALLASLALNLCACSPLTATRVAPITSITSPVTVARPSGSTVTSSANWQVAVSLIAAADSSRDAREFSQDARISSQDVEISDLSSELHVATAVPTTHAAIITTAAPATHTPTWDTNDPIFERNEENWNETLHDYASWTNFYRSQIESSGLGKFDYYLYSHFGNNAVQCGVGTGACGCNYDSLNVLDHLRDRYPNDKYQARDIYFTLDTIDTMLKSYCIFIDGTREAAVENALVGGTFASTFFPQRDEALVAKCKAINAMNDAIFVTATSLVIGLVTEGLGTLYFAAEFGGATAVLTQSGLTAAENLEKSAVRAGQQVIANVPASKAAVQAAKKSWLPPGTVKRVFDSMQKYTISNSVSKWASNYDGRMFANHMEEDDQCGLAIAKDTLFENMVEMQGFIAKNLRVWPELVTGTMLLLLNGTGTGPDGAFEDDQPSQLAVYMQNVFPDFPHTIKLGRASLTQQP